MGKKFSEEAIEVVKFKVIIKIYVFATLEAFQVSGWKQDYKLKEVMTCFGNQRQCLMDILFLYFSKNAISKILFNYSRIISKLKNKF